MVLEMPALFNRGRGAYCNFRIFWAGLGMEKSPVWSESLGVRFGAVDGSGALSLSAALGFFQEAAVSHAEALGVGREAMAGMGLAWILSRMSVRVDRRPAYGEAATARSWPRGQEKLFALRDFDLLDARGEAAIRARSCWIVLDTERRRPARPQAALEGLPVNEGLDALPFVPPGLEERAGMGKAAELRVAYGDVDFNGHVNNVSYVRWLENALEAGLLERAARMRLDANYVGEVRLGEPVELALAELAREDGPEPPRAFAFEARAGGKAAFRAELRLWV